MKSYGLHVVYSMLILKLCLCLIHDLVCSWVLFVLLVYLTVNNTVWVYASIKITIKSAHVLINSFVMLFLLYSGSLCFCYNLGLLSVPLWFTD